MTEDDRRYLCEQLGLFAGGYEHLVLEATVHFRVDVDELQLGYVVRDHRTGAYVAAQVPQLASRLTDTHKIAEEIREAVSVVVNHLDPFP